MIASYICKDLYEWIGVKERQGTIHSIFKNSINIFGEDGRLISVVTGNKPISPNGIIIGEDVSFEKEDINIGETGTFREKYWTMNGFRIYYGESALWDKKIKAHYNKDTIEKAIHKVQQLGELLLNQGKSNGILNLIPLLMKEFQLGNSLLYRKIALDKKELFIKDRLIQFIHSFINSNLEEINRNAKKIIGFGVGLTPSMDDFVSGMMIVNVYIHDFLGINMENAYRMNEEIIKDMENKTTFVSEAMLKFASVGETNEDVRNLIINIFTRGEGNIEESSMKVLALGDSSGTDILSGIYLGSLILLNKRKGGFNGTSSVSY